MHITVDRIRRSLVAAAAALFVCSAAAPAAAQTMYGITTTSHVITFQADTPGTIDRTVALSGLQPGEEIVAMDVRPATGQLLGMGDTARLYLIDPRTGSARLIGKQLAAPLNGTAFGMEVNPVTDRIRIVSDLDQNLRVNPNEGALSGDDFAINPDRHITAIAHSNNYAGAATTTLYGIDSTTNSLLMIGGSHGNPTPNIGIVFELGPLGVDTQAGVDFDIVTIGDARRGLASLTIGGEAWLHNVSLFSGTATPIGKIGGGVALTAMAAAPPIATTLYAITESNTLISFNSALPDTILAAVGVTGLNVGETLLGLDMRVADGKLYALGGSGQLYKIDPQNGQALRIGTPIDVVLNGSAFGFDFSPIADTLRVVSNAGQNLRIDPDTGALNGIDTPLSPAGNIAGAAYTLNRPNAGQLPTLYDIDITADTLVRQGGVNGAPSPNNGVLTTIGFLGVNATAVHGFDIAGIDESAYAAMTVSGTTNLYLIDLATGAARRIGQIGTSETIRGMTAGGSGIVQFASPTYLVTEGELVARLRLTRSESTSALSVQVATFGETASAGADYEPFGQFVTFPQGQAELDVIVPIVDDALDEADERLRVRLDYAGLGGKIGAYQEVDLFILDNDGPNVAPAIAITSPSSDPVIFGASGFITIGGTASDANGIASVSWISSRGTSGAATGTTNWSASIPLQPGANTIVVRATDGTGASAVDQVTIVLDTVSYTLAEGATGGFFDLDLLLANPNPVGAPVSIDFLREDGTTLTQLRTLPPLSRTTLRVDDIAGLEGGAVSTIVTSTTAQPLIVERTMRWDASHYGAHGEKATSGPAVTWYFAEGAQGFFDTFLLFTNSGGGANAAHVKFLMENGTTVTKDYPMLGSSRLSVPLNAVPQLAGQAFGIVVTFESPGVAERAMYFGTPIYNGGHDSVGETELATDWFLAEGATGGFFTTFVLLANPGVDDAEVTMTYMPEGGTPVTKPLMVGAGKRVTINVAGEDPSLAATPVATRVQSSVPIVVERAQYWPGTPSEWYEAHNSFGVTALGAKWGLAEGRIGGVDAAQTFILLANPGDSEATVTIEYLREPGRSPQTVTRTVKVPKASRVTVNPADLTALDDETFGATITSTQPIAVERALYFTVNGQTWSAGTNATATRLP